MRLESVRADRVLAQGIEDLERITSAVTVWDMVAAAIVLFASWPIGVLVGKVVRRLDQRIPGIPEDLAALVARGARVLVGLAGLALSMSLLGVSVGWFTVTLAFVAVVAVLIVRPLIENGAAGLLLRPSFAVGADIETHGFRGEVLEINARTTVIQTRDWRRVHIPNNDILSSPIVVFSAFDRMRSAINLEIEYDADIAKASRLLVEAASVVEGIYGDPPPYVRARNFGTGTYILSLRWWHDPDLSSASRTLDGVVREVKRILDAAGIGLPSPEVIVRQPDKTHD